MSDMDDECVVYGFDIDTGRTVPMRGNHEWVMSYTGNTRRCRHCMKLERLNALTNAENGDKV